MTRENSSARELRALVSACVAVGLAVVGCRDATTALGPAGPTEIGPRAGQYVVGEFEFHNACVQPPFDLTGSRATNRTAVFDFTPDSAWAGTVALTGTFEVPDPKPGAPAIAIFEGPDSGRYTIRGDTLRLRFTNRLNTWVGVIPFTQFRGGVLSGTSDNRCSTLALRLERRP